jgi:antitoxin MazE
VAAQALHLAMAKGQSLKIASSDKGVPRCKSNFPNTANENGRSRCIPKLVYSAYSPGAAMQTRVQKWGNSLGVRIPRGLAEEVGLGAGTEVSLTAKDGELVVKPALPTRLILSDLLSGVSESNIHSFVDTGSAVGAEIF